MKKYIAYIVLLLLLFLMLYWMNKDAPVQHTWASTYNTNDKQPFGTYALDKLLSKSLEKGYTHSYQSIRELSEAGKLEGANLLIITDHFNSYDEEFEVLIDYIKQGGNAFIAAGLFPGEWDGTLRTFTHYYYKPSFNLNLTLEQPKDTVLVYVDGLCRETYLIPTSMISYCFNTLESFNLPAVSDSTIHRLAEINTHKTEKLSFDKTIMRRYPMGKGNLILSCTPLVFTNYGILNDSINGYIKHSLAYLQDKPLIRTEYYGVGSQGGSEQSPFRYLLSQRPLRWALYVTFFTIVLFMIFTAKRKQKVIPLIEPPANKLLAFVNSIAALYIRKNDNADLIEKKYIYWSEELKRKYGIDCINESHNEDFFQRFSLKTGQPLDEVKLLFSRLDVIGGHTNLSDEDMMDLITKMNII